MSTLNKTFITEENWYIQENRTVLFIITFSNRLDIGHQLLLWRCIITRGVCFDSHATVKRRHYS